MTEPNFYIRQNTCPRCGCYIWAHPVEEICKLSEGEALLAYSHQVEVNREYNKRRDQVERNIP